MAYVIILNRLEGVDLILKALRKTTCIASHDLAEGINKNLQFVGEDGVPRRLDRSHERVEPVKQKLTLVKGGKDENDNVVTSEGADAS